MPNSNFYQVVPKKVSFEQFCALLSQDLWHMYMNSGDRIKATDNLNDSCQWEVKIMGNFDHQVVEQLAWYHPPEWDEIEKQNAITGNNAFHDFKERAREKTLSYLSPRWIC